MSVDFKVNVCFFARCDTCLKSSVSSTISLDYINTDEDDYLNKQRFIMLQELQNNGWIFNMDDTNDFVIGIECPNCKGIK